MAPHQEANEGFELSKGDYLMNIALERTSFRNESSLDQIIRLILAVVFFQLAFFWLGGIGQLVFYVLAGSYASDFFSRKFFLDDFNRMNNYYKQIEGCSVP
jgi:hypothetical protein